MQWLIKLLLLISSSTGKPSNNKKRQFKKPKPGPIVRGSFPEPLYCASDGATMVQDLENKDLMICQICKRIDLKRKYEYGYEEWEQDHEIKKFWTETGGAR